MKGKIKIKEIKTLSIGALIISVILLVFTSLEFVFLKILGLHYESLSSLLFFFGVYLVLEIPINLFLKSLLKALVTLNFIKSSKGFIALILNIASTFVLLKVITQFIDTVSISQIGILIFSLITGLIGWLAIQNDSEPPKRGTKEFENFKKRGK
ncbi:YrvL family regulatory protein [Exiguobacterium sp. s80]|uniref:YrvL family regulatory protein n=1 Tax=Exiguobacterium sp. s80 TaxID=2751209 RepID=UPI001BE946A0